MRRTLLGLVFVGLAGLVAVVGLAGRTVAVIALVSRAPLRPGSGGRPVP